MTFEKFPHSFKNLLRLGAGLLVAIASLALDKTTDLFFLCYSRARITSSVINFFTIQFSCQHIEEWRRNPVFPGEKTRFLWYAGPHSCRSRAGCAVAPVNRNCRH